MIECIAAGLLGFFGGAIWMGSEINDISKEKKQLKKENNHIKSIGNLHIGQIVYACKCNSFYMGEITSIVYRDSSITIGLDCKETFDIKNIYTDKNEALKQIKI